MPIVNVNQVIGKSMSLNYDAPYYKIGNVADADIKKYGKAGTLKKGQTIQVKSYLEQKPGRSNFFWTFGGQFGDFAIVHESDRFNFSDLRDQGSMTTAEITAAEKEAELTIFDKVERALSTAFNFSTGTAKTLVNIAVTFLVIFLIIILYKKSQK